MEESALTLRGFATLSKRACNLNYITSASKFSLQFIVVNYPVSAHRRESGIKIVLHFSGGWGRVGAVLILRGSLFCVAVARPLGIKKINVLAFKPPAMSVLL